MVRASLTQEVWESVNESWLTLKTVLAKPVREIELPQIFSTVRHQSALVRGALHGTIFRNEIYQFSRLGTFIERADNTARILRVKYYVLLPSVALVGSSLDNVQWESILRSTSARRAFRWQYGTEPSSRAIAELLILDNRHPRSLAFSVEQLVVHLQTLCRSHQKDAEVLNMVQEISGRLSATSIDQIIEHGLQEYLVGFIDANAALASEIEREYRFYE
jgi:uncharacterized alpha-E superfamily protein